MENNERERRECFISQRNQLNLFTVIYDKGPLNERGTWATLSD